MPKNQSWARAWAVSRATSRPRLRQGAWYRVVGDEQPDRLVLDVEGARAVVREKVVEVRDGLTSRFTVVYRGYDEANPALGSAADRGRIYGVCPMSGHRVRLAPGATRAVCQRCGHEGEVAGWETG
jgi:hypothetical protein